MLKKIFIVFLTLIIVLSCCGCNKEKDNTKEKVVLPQINTNVIEGEIQKNSNYNYIIVYPSNCNEALITAAKQLQQYIEQAVGVKLNYYADGEVSQNSITKMILLGKTKFFTSRYSNIKYTDLGSDGFVIKSFLGNVLIDANTPRGILYGAYDFLEKIVGIKFLTYDYTFVPTLDKINIYEMNIKEVPAIENRVFLSRQTMNNQEFTSHMRFNDEYINMSEAYGGDIGFVPNQTHNMLEYVPISFYDEHNEWFYCSNDKIVDICYSHVGLKADGSIDDSLQISPVKIAIDNFYETITNPQYAKYKYFMIAQQDNPNGCTCSECQAQSLKYERSGMLIRFINAINRGVKDKLERNGIKRDFNIITFAYLWSEKPPYDYKNDRVLDPTVVPDDNIYIRLAPINALNYYSMTSEFQQDTTRTMFTYWPKVASNFMVWTYNIDYGGYFIYYPTIQHWQEDLKLYQSIGVKYLMFQSAYNEDIVWQDHMNAYIASKMMWNPDLSADALKKEFVKYYFAEFYEYIQSFIDNLDMQYSIFLGKDYPESERPTTRINGESLLSSSLYTTSFWEQELELLDNAIKAVNASDLTDSQKITYNKRINMVKLTPQYMVASRYNEYYIGNIGERQNFLTDFFNNCAQLGVKVYRESTSISDLKVNLNYTDA